MNLRFRVDSKQQKLYLKTCPSLTCLNFTVQPIYDLTLICTDNYDKGLSGYSTITIVVNSVFQRGFKMLNKFFYLLATGSNRIEIPTLKFKVIVTSLTFFQQSFQFYLLIISSRFSTVYQTE